MSPPVSMFLIVSMILDLVCLVLVPHSVYLVLLAIMFGPVAYMALVGRWSGVIDARSRDQS